MVKSFALTFVAAALLPALYGQTADQGAAAQTPILQQYDQAIDQVAERAMQSVVKIEVTGYGVPESDKTMGQPDQGQQASQQSLERQRSIGSGVIVDPDGYIIEVGQTTDPKGDWWPAGWQPIKPDERSD